VEQEIAEALNELDRKEYNNTQKETRRHVTFDVSEELSWLAVDDQRLARVLDGATEETRLHAAISKLSTRQQTLIRDLFFHRKTQAAIAEQLGISQQAVSDQLSTIIKKLKKLL
jgi:RNA polymerase sigma factor (sigma-70 family)